MSRIIVGVPGPWEVRGDLIAALARTHGTDYIFAGLLFMETGTKTMCEFDWCGPDDRMRGAFEVAGQGMLPGDVLDAVEAHRSTAYLIFGEPGYETARAAARFAVALLDAGGIAVKVDSAGVAHSRERWLQGAESAEPFDTYSLFVVLVGSEERYYSCGMHNFGLPDAAVSTSMENQEAAHLLNVFNMYQLVESPALNDGETFSMDAGSPRFRLKREPYVEGYDPGEPLYNPHGLWLLQPPGDPPAKKRWRWSFRG